MFFPHCPWSIVLLKYPSKTIFIRHHYILFPYVCIPRKKCPLTKWSLVLCSEGGINTDNIVIKGSNLEGHKSSFWIGFNLSNTFKAWMKQSKHSFCVTISRREKARTQKIASYLVYSQNKLMLIDSVNIIIKKYKKKTL